MGSIPISGSDDIVVTQIRTALETLNNSCQVLIGHGSRRGRWSAPWKPFHYEAEVGDGTPTSADTNAVRSMVGRQPPKLSMRVRILHRVLMLWGRRHGLHTKDHRGDARGRRGSARRLLRELRLGSAGGGGGNHARVWVGDEYTTVPRHKEMPNRFARKILKQIGVK